MSLNNLWFNASDFSEYSWLSRNYSVAQNTWWSRVSLKWLDHTTSSSRRLAVEETGSSFYEHLIYYPTTAGVFAGVRVCFLICILIPTLILLHLMRLSSLGAIALREKCPCHALFSSSYYGWLCLIFMVVTQLAVPIFALGWLSYYYFEAAFPLYVSVIGALMCIGFFYGSIFALGGFIYFLMGKVFWDRDVVLLRLYYVFMAAYWALLLLSFSFRIYCDLVHFDVFGKLVGLMPVAYCEPAVELSAINKTMLALVKSAVVMQQQGAEKDALGLKVFKTATILAERLVLTHREVENFSPEDIKNLTNRLRVELLDLMEGVCNTVFFPKFDWIECLPGQLREYQSNLFRITLRGAYQNFIFYNPQDFPEISCAVNANLQFHNKLDSFIFPTEFKAITPEFIRINRLYLENFFIDLQSLVLPARTTIRFEDAMRERFAQYMADSSSVSEEKNSIELLIAVPISDASAGGYIPDSIVSDEAPVFVPQAIVEDALIPSSIVVVPYLSNAAVDVAPVNILVDNVVVAPRISLPQIEVISELNEATKKRIHISLDKLSATMDNTGYLTRFWNWCFSANLSDQEYINNLYSTTNVKTQERMLAGLDLPPENPKRHGTFLFPEKWCFVGEELRPNGTDLSVKFAFDEGKFGISVNDSHDARWQKFLTASGRK